MKKLTVDNRGLGCPQPVINTKKALGAKNFDELTILIDNDVALSNVKRLIKKTGFEINKEEKKDGIYSLLIKNNFGKTEDSYDAETKSEHGKNILFLNDKIGAGNDDLGRLLMNGFIYSLTESENMPGKLIFMNNGVKLCAEGSEAVKNLRMLEDRGAEILVCGTCLNFFDITDKLAVGKISNMYDISESMLEKSELITID